MEKKFKTIINLYFALVFGAIFAYLSGTGGDISGLFIVEDHQLIMLFIPLGFYLTGEILMRYFLKTNLNSKNNIGTHEGFQSAILIKWALLEGGAFMTLFSEDLPQFNLLIFLFLFIVSFPNKRKYDKHIGLNIMQ